MQETYQEILKVGYALQQALDNAMVLCHSWGYNGLKRWHRYNKRHLDNWCLLIKNEMYDDHELMAHAENGAYKAYSPADIKEHAQRWYNTLKDACSRMAGLNVKLVGQTGYQSCLTKNLLKCLYKQKEKAHRFLKRGDEVQWMAHDLHMYDDALHEKVKCKEKKELEHWPNGG